MIRQLNWLASRCALARDVFPSMQRLLVKSFTASAVRGLEVPSDVVTLIFEFAFPPRRGARRLLLDRICAEEMAIWRAIRPEYKRRLQINEVQVGLRFSPGRARLLAHSSAKHG